MQPPQSNEERALDLFSFELGNFGFNLLTIHADATGFRVAFCEVVIGEKSGALAGFMARNCPDCGQHVCLDLFWMGLFHG